MGNVFKYAEDVTDSEEKDKNDETSSEEFEIDATHVEKVSESGNSDSSVNKSAETSRGSSTLGSFGKGVK